MVSGLAALRRPGMTTYGSTSPERYSSIADRIRGLDGEGTDRDHTTSAVLLAAVRQSTVNRLLLTSRLEHEARPSGGADSDSAPAARAVPQAARDTLSRLGHDGGVARMKKSNHLHRGRNRNHEGVINGDDHA